MSEFIDYLDDVYGIKEVAGGKQVKLASGSCPFCGKEGRDLRIYYNAECTDITAKKGYCHHCPRGFSAIEFVAAAEECSLKEAAKILAGDDDQFVRSRIDSEEQKNSEMIYPQLFPITDFSEALVYAQGRNMTPELALQLGIYYSPYNVLHPDGETTTYSNQRLVFMIYDADGQPVSWQGRDTTDTKKDKYLFPVGFKKAEYLYGIHRIPQNPEYMLLCEGSMDVLGWVRAGFDYAVATFGKNLSRHQKQIIKRKNPKGLYIAWDADASWNKYKLMEELQSFYDDIKFIDLGEKDADELTKEELTEAFDNRREYSWEDKILSSLTAKPHSVGQVGLWIN